MKISQRAQAITPFLAMEFGKRAAALEAAGHRVIRLNLGEPDFGAPPAVRAELQRIAPNTAMPYTGALGLPALREAIAGFYQSAHGVLISPRSHRGHGRGLGRLVAAHRRLGGPG